MNLALPISPEAIARAQSLGMDASDQQVAESTTQPIWSVVMPGSTDAFYSAVVNGKTVQVGRVGHFRQKQADGSMAYEEVLGPLVIIDSRTSNVRFDKSGERPKPVCRGISTQGMFDALCNWGEAGVGASCKSCPWNRWVWDEQRGQGESTTGPNGEVITKQTLCQGQLSLYCWDPETDARYLVNWAAGAFSTWRELVKGIQQAGCAAHQFMVTLQAKELPGKQGQMSSYVPHLLSAQDIDPETFAKVRELRAQVQKDIAASTGLVQAAALPPAPRANSIAEAQARALPAAQPTGQPSAFKDVPITDPNDVFADDNAGAV